MQQGSDSSSLVFLGLCGLLRGVTLRMRLITAHFLRVVRFLTLQTAGLVQLLGFLEELVEIKLPDNIFLEIRQT